MSTDYGEPWKRVDRPDTEGGRTVYITNNGGGTVVSVGDRFSFHPITGRETNRIILCVNALAGVDDPAKELERLRGIEKAAKADIEFAREADWLVHGICSLEDAVKDGCGKCSEFYRLHTDLTRAVEGKE